MRKELEYIVIDYTKDDVDYIDTLCNSLNEKSKEVIQFLNIKEFGEKVKVKLWNSIEEFRNLHKSLFHKVDANGQVPNWISGFALGNEVQTLSLAQYRKTKNHECATIIDLEKLIIHEFTHAAHSRLHDNRIMLWLTEGLATFLAHQYDDKELEFNATLEEIKVGKTSYTNYYIMFNYVLNTYGKDYILKLIKDEELLQNETNRLYEETKERFGKEG